MNEYLKRSLLGALSTVSKVGFAFGLPALAIWYAFTHPEAVSRALEAMGVG